MKDVAQSETQGPSAAHGFYVEAGLLSLSMMTQCASFSVESTI